MLSVLANTLSDRHSQEERRFPTSHTIAVLKLRNPTFSCRGVNLTSWPGSTFKMFLPEPRVPEQAYLSAHMSSSTTCPSGNRQTSVTKTPIPTSSSSTSSATRFDRPLAPVIVEKFAMICGTSRGLSSGALPHPFIASKTGLKVATLNLYCLGYR